jgi:hypothetical protein
MASRGCPVGCSFCIVPAMEGRTFTYLREFPARPVLCDNNLSALTVRYQQYIIERYERCEVELLDANSGFEPRTFDGGTFERWSKILRGPWRFGYDDLQERGYVRDMMALLRSKGVTPRKMQVYCMIGGEPVDACLQRIQEIIEWGGEPYCQRKMKLNALEKKPWVQFDWTAETLAHVARWVNRRIWRYAPLSAYDANVKTSRSRGRSSQLALV